MLPAFYTPPASPVDHDVYFTPPDSPSAPAAVIDSLVPDPTSDDVFPLPSDLAIDLALDGESLTILEKIYLYSRSRAYYHRIFIVHQLAEYLDHVTPQEAVEYVLPLLSGLAMDEGVSFASRPRL
jgi:serine/threonine-protein phosphatase 4 regulatory subunit 1